MSCAVSKQENHNRSQQMVIDAFYCEMGSHKKKWTKTKEVKQIKEKKNNHYKKNDEGVKEEAYKSGCGLDINILRNKLAQIKTLEHTSTLFWLGKKKKEETVCVVKG